MFSLSTNTLYLQYLHIRVQASGGVLAVEVPRQEVGGEAEHHRAEVDNVHGGGPPVRMPSQEMKIIIFLLETLSSYILSCNCDLAEHRHKMLLSTPSGKVSVYLHT